MRAFDDLTARGQVRRLRGLALDALDQYDLEVTSCSFVARAFNTVFRVDLANGSSYALRMSPSLRIHADGCEAVEAAWLAALSRDADVSVPQVVPTRDASAVAWASTAGVPDARSCVLFEWLRGRSLREGLRADLVRKVGELTAIVHEHGAGYVSEPPAGALIADRVLYFCAAPRLEMLRPAYGAVLEEAVARAQQSLDELWRHPPHRPHLLHGDVHPGNVMVKGNEVVLLDFQDLIWGFEVQDVSIALLWFEFWNDPIAMTDAFRAGYTAVRPWPDADAETLDALRAARHLNVLDFGLNMGGAGVDEFITRHAAPVVEWMTLRMK